MVLGSEKINAFFNLSFMSDFPLTVSSRLVVPNLWVAVCGLWVHSEPIQTVSIFPESLLLETLLESPAAPQHSENKYERITQNVVYLAYF